MKNLYIYMFISLIVLVGMPNAFAQIDEQNPLTLRVAEDQRRLFLADSVYKLHEARAEETRADLKSAQAELKSAQARYNEAKRRDKEASNAAKQAKKAYKMEEKAQKARNKAEKQASKAKSAALQSDRFY